MSITMERASLNCESADHDYYKRISQEAAGTALDAPFPSMVRAYVALACLGYRMDRYEPLINKQEISLSSYLDTDTEVPVLFALAMARLRTQDPGADTEALAQQLLHIRDILNVVEGWANGGLKAFREELESGKYHGHMTEKVIRMLEDLKSESGLGD